MKEMGPVDPMMGAELLPGAFFEANRNLGDRIVLSDGTVFEQPSGGRWRTAQQVEVLIRRAQQVLLLYVPMTNQNCVVYDIGRPSPRVAWRERLRAQYIQDDGWPPRGYSDTALLARRWTAPSQVVLVFAVAC